MVFAALKHPSVVWWGNNSDLFLVYRFGIQWLFSAGIRVSNTRQSAAHEGRIRMVAEQSELEANLATGIASPGWNRPIVMNLGSSWREKCFSRVMCHMECVGGTTACFANTLHKMNNYNTITIMCKLWEEVVLDIAGAPHHYKSASIRVRGRQRSLNNPFC